MYKIFNECRICGNDNLIPLLNLGNQVLSGIFPAKNEIDPSISPLVLVKCVGTHGNENSCGLVQLKHSASLDEMYGKTYGYHSSLSNSMVLHLNSKVDELVSIVELKEGDVVLDIGCNDGTLLNRYSHHFKLDRNGIDPSSEKFRSYFDQDIKVEYDFFNSYSCVKLLGEKKCKIITSIAMFYDLDYPLEFVSEISNRLDENGIWAFELSYYPLLLSQLTYDQICHEHVTYYGLTELKNLVEKFSLKIIDFSFNDMNGGSIYLKVSKNSSRYIPNLKKINDTLLKEESTRDINKLYQFSRRIENHKDELIHTINTLLINGKSILGYGASTKGNIIINYCGITKEMIPFIGDLNIEKHGLEMPGSRITITSHEEIQKLNPDYLLVFVWHLRKEVILLNLNYLKKGGKLIFPLPRLHIVTVNNYERFLNSEFDDLAFSI